MDTSDGGAVGEPGCPANLDTFWRSANDIVGSLPFIDDAFKIFTGISKALRAIECHTDFSLVDIIEAIVHREIDAALVEQNQTRIRSILEQVESLPTQVNDREFGTQYSSIIAAVNRLTTEEELASQDGLGALEALVLASSAKFYALTVEAVLARAQGNSYQFHRSMHRVIEQVQVTQTHLDNYVAVLDENLDSYEVVLGGSNFAGEFRGEVHFPDGTRTVSDTWHQCGFIRDCSGAREAATADGVALRTAERNRVRAELIGPVDEYRTELAEIRASASGSIARRNLAHGVTVDVNGAGTGTYPDSASVDGDTLTLPEAEQHGVGATWVFDLGAHYMIDSIALHARTENIDNLRVQTLATNPQAVTGVVWQSLYPTSANEGEGDSWSQADFTWPQSGDASYARWIHVAAAPGETTGSIRIAELVVYGANIARGRPTTSSSGTSSAACVDGNRTGPNCNTLIGYNQWWEVDLGTNREVGRVVVSPARGQNSTRPGVYTVELLSAPEPNGIVLATQTFIAYDHDYSFPYVVTFPEARGRPAAGRAVRVTWAGENLARMDAAEIMVFPLDFGSSWWGSQPYLHYLQHPVVASARSGDNL